MSTAMRKSRHEPSAHKKQAIDSKAELLYKISKDTCTQKHKHKHTQKQKHKHKHKRRSYVLAVSSALMQLSSIDASFSVGLQSTAAAEPPSLSTADVADADAGARATGGDDAAPAPAAAPPPDAEAVPEEG